MSTLAICTDCSSTRSYPTVMDRVDVRPDGSQVRTPVVCICCLDCPHFYESKISVRRFNAMKRLIAEDKAAGLESCK